MMLKDFEYFNSHTKSMEGALKRPRQANGWSSNTGYIFSFKPFWKTCFDCFLTQKYYSFRYVYKIDFIMTSVSVHVTFKSGKIMHLNCYFFFILTPPKKKSLQKCTRWANFNQIDTKACISDNGIDLCILVQCNI